ncbi:MAG: prepilin-type N-terminal cleavage/methylation domain-containing protein [Bermanella sp.]
MPEVASHKYICVYPRQKGVTLIELIITIVVLGIALSALVTSLSSAISRSSTPFWEGQALELTQAYLDEILSMKFDDASPSGGGKVETTDNPCVLSNEGQARDNFDDVDDYENVIDSPPTLIDTTIDMSEYQNYSVSIRVQCAGLDLGLSDNELAKRISVSVTVPSGDNRTVSVYRGNF